MSVVVSVAAADGAQSTISLPAPVVNTLLPIINIPGTQEAVIPGAVIVQPQGTTDISANLVSAMTQIRQSATLQNLWAPSATKYLLLGPGVYTVAQLNALLGQEGATGQSLSLVIKGAGYNQTTVVFSPSSTGSLMTNNFWQGLRVEGITFVATRTDSTFLSSVGNNAAQDYVFTDCLWKGWNYIVDLTGANNNSEYRFFGCYGVNNQPTGAWLHIGSAGSDQFLNYWWYGCKWWQTSAPIIDAALGGSFKIYGMDVSDFGNHGNGPGGSAPCLFYFRNTGHAQGVCNAHINGLRVEMKNAAGTILNCQWNYGAVSFTDLDMSSQLFAFTYTGNVLDVGPGVNVSLRDSSMGGKINAPGRSGAPVLVDNCQWWQQASMAAVAPAGGVKFFNSSTGTNGAVWNN